MNTTKSEFLLLFHGSAWYNKLSPEELQNAMNEFKAWFDKLSQQGKLKGAQPLARDGAIVSGKSGRVLADGPYAESKEAIGGYFLLAVDSLEEAIAVAKEGPMLQYGVTVEVRPV